MRSVSLRARPIASRKAIEPQTTASREGTPVTAGGRRLHWIDWLRVAAVAGVFLYHTFRPFDSTAWHVKNAETSDLIGGAQIFFATFGLAVLFLVSGAGVQFALRKRTWRTFVRERTARLLVPFLVGTLLLSPIQAFIQAKSEGTATGPLPDYLGWWGSAIGKAGEAFTPRVFGLGYHLWFLGFLFAFSVVALPLFAALRRPGGTRAVATLARAIDRAPGSTLLFAGPIALAILVFAPLGTDEHDWAEFGWYLAYFVIGFVLVADERFLESVRRDLPIVLIAAGASVAALVGLDFGQWFTDPASRGVDLRSLAVVATWAFEGWAITLLVVNLGLRLASMQRPVGQRLGEAVLPVYVVHQPVILALALGVVGLPLGIAPKWVLLFGVSLAATLALVEAGLRVPAVRILLGARPLPAVAMHPGVDGSAGGGPLAAPRVEVGDARAH